MTGSNMTRIEDRAGGVRVITLDRPQKLNAFNLELTLDLLEALRDAQADTGVGAVVLAAAGRAFSAGADLSELKGSSWPSGPAGNASYRGDLLLELHAAFSRMDKTVVGAVIGLALGGGCGIALACDLLIASEDATFGYPEVKLGGMPAIVIANLVRQVGLKAGYELMALGHSITAQRAHELGLVNRVVPAEQLLTAAVEMASAIAACDPVSMSAAKRLFYRTADLPLIPALQAARDANVIMRSHEMRWGQAST